MPPAGQAAKNPARENLGRDIVVRISRYNRPESIAAGDGHPLARYRCDTEGLLLNRPCIGRILFVVAHHLFPTCLQLISLSLGLDDNGLRAAASGPVETAFVRAVIFNASGQQRTVGDIYFRRTADIEQCELAQSGYIQRLQRCGFSVAIHYAHIFQVGILSQIQCRRTNRFMISIFDNRLKAFIPSGSWIEV